MAGWQQMNTFSYSWIPRSKGNSCMKSTIIFSPKIGSKKHQKKFRGNEKRGLLENRNAGGFNQLVDIGNC